MPVGGNSVPQRVQAWEVSPVNVARHDAQRTEPVLWQPAQWGGKMISKNRWVMRWEERKRLFVLMKWLQLVDIMDMGRVGDAHNFSLLQGFVHVLRNGKGKNRMFC